MDSVASCLHHVKNNHTHSFGITDFKKNIVI